MGGAAGVEELPSFPRPVQGPESSVHLGDLTRGLGLGAMAMAGEWEVSWAQDKLLT